jgi:hypothetical protein
LGDACRYEVAGGFGSIKADAGGMIMEKISNPSDDVFWDLLLSKVMNESNIVYIIECASNIHKYGREYLLVAPGLMDVFTKKHHYIFY